MSESDLMRHLIPDSKLLKVELNISDINIDPDNIIRLGGSKKNAKSELFIKIMKEKPQMIIANPAINIHYLQFKSIFERGIAYNVKNIA